MTRYLGNPVPLFSAVALQDQKIIPSFEIKHLIGKRILLFFYPWDSSFSCPSELNAFQSYAKEFEKLDTTVIISMARDVYSIQALLQPGEPQCFTQAITFPILADEDGKLARLFDVVSPDNQTIYRALFFIDEQGIIRQEVVNDTAIKRSPEEALRCIKECVSL